ncbi:GntR family transcriptional regulator [Microbacterium sp. NPDC089695]|uniref:GntR family transcriptional regulator n=1 Tax=Microbacterium sp. NPDC089695 TaxID=3364198 RepID=UPI00380AC821
MSDNPQFQRLRPRTLIREQVFDRIARDIVSGRLQPMDEICASDLQAEFGVSRTPIREALLRLAHLGLIDISANRYTRVAPIDPTLQRERMGAAHALIGHCARHLAADAATDALAGLCRSRDGVHELEGRELVEIAGLTRWYRFFEQIVVLTGNNVVHALLRDHLGLHLLRSVAAARLPEAAATRLREDVDRVLAAILAGDGDAAQSGVIEALDISR